MPLTPGTKLGPYEIVAPLGAGGMGEVYRAKDPRLGRDVAIKVLPLHLSANPEVRARFEREAKTVSSFNHPHICTLFDVGREGETDYLVMELVDGETLASRLQRGPMTAAELLRLGSQIAEALDRAHRAGVIHRDLKPGNIMITRSGAKLMDFGLARATGLGGTSTGSGVTMAALTRSPTVAQPLTAEGTILGTFQYMSPEQLEGKEADARSDIWSMGCMLYEMATGRRAFEGRSQASLIAAILERETPSLGEAPSSGSASLAASGPPAGLDWLIRNCLTKDPDERIQTAHDVKLQLQRIAEGAGLSTGVARSGIGLPAPGVTPATLRRGRASAGWIAAATVLIAAIGFAAWAWPRLSAHPVLYRFKPETEFAGIQDASWPRLAPDGRSLTFMGPDSSGVSRAWLLRFDETVAHPIAGTERLQRDYWSPDSREIAFVADDKIQRVAVGGGTPIVVCPAPGGADLSWGSKGSILLDGSSSDSLRAVPAGGGELHPATRVYRSDHEIGSAWPSFLPDGQHFLFIGLRSDGLSDNIRLGSIGSLDSKLIGHSDGRVEYAPGGWVVSLRKTSLVAQRLDLGAGRLTGEPITLVDEVRVGSSSGDFSTSSRGSFVFQSGAAAGITITTVDRTGRTLETLPVTGSLSSPRFSPDGRRVLYERHAGGGPWGDVSVFDLERGTDTPLTFTGGWAVRSNWSPDGRRFAYTRTSPTAPDKVIVGSSDGLAAPDSLDASAKGFYLTQWLPTGQLVGYTRDGEVQSMPVAGAERTPKPMLGPGELMSHPQVSPDGRWLAGVSSRGAAFQVFVRSLQGPAGRWQISSENAGKPFWTKGGRELVFSRRDRMLMAVDIDTQNGFHAGVPRALFQLPYLIANRELGSWGPDTNGERFVVLALSRAAGPARSIEVVSDFRSLVERK